MKGLTLSIAAVALVTVLLTILSPWSAVDPRGELPTPSVNLRSELPAPPVPSTPGPNAMTVYAVANPNSFSIAVRHVITDSASFRYEFDSTIPANSTVQYHLRDMPSVPSPFDGAMTLYSDQQFTAALVGYDYYPGSPIPTSTPDCP